jgi:hypothetical protein
VVAWMLGSRVRILLRTWMCFACCADSTPVVPRTPAGCESVEGTSAIWRRRPQWAFVLQQKKKSNCIRHFACRCCSSTNSAGASSDLLPFARPVPPPHRTAGNGGPYLCVDTRRTSSSCGCSPSQYHGWNLADRVRS